MRTFYLFKLKDMYKNCKDDSIYILFKSIYTYDKGNIFIAFDLFNDICLPINTDFINNYIYNKLNKDEYYTKFKNIHMYNNFFTNEVSKMSVLKSHIKVRSNSINNIFINNLREITDYFVCDFIYDNYELFSNNNGKKKV